MRRITIQIVGWVGLYVLVCAVPLVGALLGSQHPGRGFWVEFGVGLGMVGFFVLGLQFLTTARFHWVAPYFGSDNILQFHRQTGIVALVLILAHPAILFLANPAYLEFLDPRVNVLRTMALVAALIALVLLVVLPLWRLSFRLNYEWWRITHAILAALVIFIGLVHTLQVGHYATGLLQQIFWIGAAVIFLAALVHVRIIKPLQMSRRPWRVTEVRDERGEVWTLILEPDGHDGMKFEPGQYVWLTLGDNPFSLQQNPFTISSSANQSQHLEITAKELGDLTATFGKIAPGTRAFLEGPYGTFTLEPTAPGAVLLMGGIGVTPAMSILRTCRDRNDTRPFWLFYGNIEWKDVTFRDELEELQKQLNLHVIHVVEQPPPDWQGESGYLTPELLEKHLGKGEQGEWHYFVCGPEPMMNLVETTLLKRGVARTRLFAERFNIV